VEPNASENLDGTKARLRGRVVSRGIAAGTVFVLPKTGTFVERRDLNDDAIIVELERLESAKVEVIAQLRAASDEHSASISSDANEILQAQIAMIEDAGFGERIRDRIRNDRFGAQLALRIVSDEYGDQLRSINDAHIQEKAADLQDVSEQLLSALSDKLPPFEVPHNAVIVASEIWPTSVLSLAEKNPVAIVTEAGGWTSHAFILARELGIPAISGVKDVDQRLSTGDQVIVDAIKGNVTFSPPSVETSLEDKENTNSDQNGRGKLRSVVVFDNDTELHFLANADSPEKCSKVFNDGLAEIGLLRSEYLFEVNERLPDETTQTVKYSEIARIAQGRPIAIRTFDVSIGRLIAGGSKNERNPALGLRSIRLTLKYERQFRAQLRSLINANSSGNISIVIPMVSGAGDVMRIRSLLNAEFENLRRKGAIANLPSLGAMIELPSAVLTVDQILEVSDFVCVGTNDLVQYTLGVDRDNESVADWYQTLHPSIIRSLAWIFEAAIAAKKSVTICGEMAGSPFYLPLLVGLGVRRFSMNPSSIPSMIEHSRGLSLSECSVLSDKILRSTLASQNEKMLAEFCYEIWPHLADERVNFPPTYPSKF